MSTAATRSAHPIARPPTIWGLDPIQLHDHYWAARGVSVVRPGQRESLPHGAELYLLTDPSCLVLFHLGSLIETLTWTKPSLLVIRLNEKEAAEYSERVVADASGRFIRFNRAYMARDRDLTRVALTRDVTLAETWKTTNVSSQAWRNIRRASRGSRREIVRLVGRCYDSNRPADLSQLVTDLVDRWREPATLLPVNRVAPRGWAHAAASVDPTAKMIGAIWIGAGRSVSADTCLLGPAALWDLPANKPAVKSLIWSDLEPASASAITVRQALRHRKQFRLYQFTKRAFDLIVGVVGLAITLPLYLPIMLAIWLEDGRPFFFIHKREARSGREFPLIKFRSMRRDAEIAKLNLQRSNKADGPQFYMPGDPRITRVGRFLRRSNLDELPQFWNVLLGHMSLVGPRPSPHTENQFCPPWREARLSVRPGITGLWQVKRTREHGLDFQEWIRYDLAYVEHASWKMDLKIILSTFRVLLFWN